MHRSKQYKTIPVVEKNESKRHITKYVEKCIPTYIRLRCISCPIYTKFKNMKDKSTAYVQ